MEEEYQSGPLKNWDEDPEGPNFRIVFSKIDLVKGSSTTRRGFSLSSTAQGATSNTMKPVEYHIHDGA